MKRQAGFTLLEVIAALAVFGLLLVALSQGVQFGVRASAIQARDSERRLDMEAVDRTLRLLIRRIQPGDDRNPIAAIQGGPATVDLQTQFPLPPGPVPSRMVSATLGVVAQRLVLRWAPVPHASWLGAPAGETETVLLDGVAQLQVAYWRAAAGGGGTWLSAWTETAPPALVRLRIRFAAANRTWPDIVVAPALDHG